MDGTSRASDQWSGRAIGGAARVAAMTPAERSAMARKGALAKRANASIVPVAYGSPDRPIHIGDIDIECYVLADSTRVITQAGLLQGLGRHRRATGQDESSDDQLPPVLSGRGIRPYISDELLEQAAPISFRMVNGSRGNGYRAEVLPAICEVYLAARANGALPRNQAPIAARAELLVRGLARVGIIALVDEATGYQDERTRDALSTILEAFIAKELQAWISTFPPNFYRHMFRLRGMEYRAESVDGTTSSRRPQYFGHLTNDIVYSRLAPGVLDELKKVKREEGRPSQKLFQRLTKNVGYSSLLQHLGSVTTLMAISKTWPEFKLRLDEVHPAINMPPTMWSVDEFED